MNAHNILNSVTKKCFFVAKFFSDNLRNTSLNQLYLKILKSKPNRGAFMYTPLVKHSEMTPKYSKENGDFCHEAGFDAVMSGAIFIRIAHLMAGVEYL